MKLREWLDQWSMSSLKINLGILDAEWKPNDHDKDAAWELYIELITRVATQQLEPDAGDENAALDSIYKLFDLTRATIKGKGRHCIEFTRIAVVVLNQKIRPFTAKWHRLAKQGAFTNEVQRALFRTELDELQTLLRNYTRMLAAMAAVEDLTDVENKI